MTAAVPLTGAQLVNFRGSHPKDPDFGSNNTNPAYFTFLAALYNNVYVSGVKITVHVQSVTAPAEIWIMPSKSIRTGTYTPTPGDRLDPKNLHFQINGPNAQPYPAKRSMYITANKMFARNTRSDNAFQGEIDDPTTVQSPWYFNLAVQSPGDFGSSVTMLIYLDYYCELRERVDSVPID